MMSDTLLDLALMRLDEAASLIAVDSDVIEKLRFPRETIQMRLLIRMDNGSRKSFLAWRCRYDDTRGPTKGGIRFHPQSAEDEIETLAFWMTFKCAVMNLPYGGGKGAIRVDPRTLSRTEFERLSRAYMQAFAQVIGPDRDIPAPDVYSNDMVMGWMGDEYNQIVGRIAPGAITGKPLALGGSLGREDATARGGYYLVCHLAHELGLAKTMNVIIQGFGKAGRHMARLLAADGHRIIGVSDSAGAIYQADGLDIEKLIAAKTCGRAVPALSDELGASGVSAEALLGLECDLLVPAAMENMIDADNAEQVGAKVILELANGPITPAADAILERRGIVVLPDILANAGGVTVSYFEWVQNRQGFAWSIEDIYQRLTDAMEREGRTVWAKARQHGTSCRTAAYVHALSRLATAIEAHGTQSFFTT